MFLWFQKAYPCRIPKITLINTPYFVDKVLALFRPFMAPKLMARVSRCITNRPIIGKGRHTGLILSLQIFFLPVYKLWLSYFRGCKDELIRRRCLQVTSHKDASQLLDLLPAHLVPQDYGGDAPALHELNGTYTVLYYTGCLTITEDFKYYHPFWLPSSLPLIPTLNLSPLFSTIFLLATQKPLLVNSPPPTTLQPHHPTPPAHFKTPSHLAVTKHCPTSLLALSRLTLNPPPYLV